MNKNIIKSLHIINANYLIIGKDGSEVKLSVDYKNNKYKTVGDKKSLAYSEAVKKAKDLLKRKSGINLV